jgi:hypothetical protein
MTFLQPYILWGLPLLLIPVIIHLINRLRHRPQQWGAMRFLRSASQSSISQAKLRQFLVLLFRVLAVLALIAFLSRPLAGGWVGWALSPAPEVIMLVLDRSASMEVQAGNGEKTCREEALELWGEALRPFQGSSRFVLIDNVGNKAQEIPSVGALKEASFSGPTDARADIPAMLQRAYNYLIETRSGAAEIWIASDLQASNWKAGDAQWQRIVQQFNALPQKVRFRLLSFEGPVKNNVSISLVEAVRRSRNLQSALEVTLDFQQSGTGKEPLVLRSSINGAESQTTIEMSGQALRWRNSFPLGNMTGAGSGSFQLASDANGRDNQVFFAYEPERSASALIVSPDPKNARPLSFAAADLLHEQPKPARVISPEEFGGVSLTNIALIAWSGPLPTGVLADSLNQFANSGGEVIFFPSSAPSPAQVAGMGWGEAANATSNQVMTVSKWNELDGPLAKTEEGLGVPLTQLEVYRRAAISGQGTILASFGDSAPFLVRKIAGKGAIYFCATSPDANWSSLAEGPVLVPMLQRLLNSGARRVNSAAMVECDELAVRSSDGWVSMEGKKNPRTDAGVYRANNRLVAVNRSAQENELERLDSAEAKKLFGNLSFQMHRDKSTRNDRLQGEVWRMFLVLMLLFLIVEGLLVLPPRHRADGRELEQPVRSAPKRETEVAA